MFHINVLMDGHAWDRESLHYGINGIIASTMSPVSHPTTITELA